MNLKQILLIILSMVMEKNPQKVLSTQAPISLSMTRIVILAFAVGLFRQMWMAGIAGWPEATLCIALVFSNQLASALDKLPAKDVLDFGKAIVSRFGMGEVRQVGNLYPENLPSKYDDESQDS